MSEQNIFHLVIRLPKEEAAFFYFQLEANEGLCFYSTLESSLREAFRDIDIKSGPEFASEVKRIIAKLQEKFPIEILVEETL